jgi:hypothetical protein
MKISFKILIPTALMLLAAVSTVSYIGYTNIAHEMNNVMELTTQGTLEDILIKIKSVDLESKALKASLNRNFLRIARAIAS